MSDTEQKPKRVMSDELKAKMKAGRELAKAKREEAKAEGVAVPKKGKKTPGGGGAGVDADEPPKSDSENSTTPKRKGKPLTDEQKALMAAGREAAKAKRDADKAAGIVTPKKEKKAPKVPDTPKKAPKPESAESKTTTAMRLTFMLKSEDENIDEDMAWAEYIYHFTSSDSIRKFVAQQFEEGCVSMFQDIIGKLDNANIAHADFIKKVVDGPNYEHMSFGPKVNVLKASIQIIA